MNIIKLKNHELVTVYGGNESNYRSWGIELGYKFTRAMQYVFWEKIL